MNSSPYPPADPLTRIGGYPIKPVPFDIAQWRKTMTAWWSGANREAINWAIRNGRTF